VAGWKDTLKQVADQGKQAAEQGRAKLAEQAAKQSQQWADDPSTLWHGESRDVAAKTTGVAKARYRITRDRVWIASGLLGTRTESVPLWAVKDIDVRQAVWQRGNDVGDVVLTLEDPAYATDAAALSLTGVSEHGTTSGQVVLDDVERPFAVVDLLTPLVGEARTKKTVERQSQYLHVNPMAGALGAVGTAVPQQPTAPGVDLADQLRKLAELRDAGVLTEEEFAAQKSRLLGV